MSIAMTIMMRLKNDEDGDDYTYMLMMMDERKSVKYWVMTLKTKKEDFFSFKMHA